jgi:hypothetical protein
MKDVDEIEHTENVDNKQDKENGGTIIEGEVDKTPDK